MCWSFSFPTSSWVTLPFSFSKKLLKNPAIDFFLLDCTFRNVVTYRMKYITRKMLHPIRTTMIAMTRPAMATPLRPLLLFRDSCLVSISIFVSKWPTMKTSSKKIISCEQSCKGKMIKGVLHLLPKISMFCALSQNNQHLV